MFIILVRLSLSIAASFWAELLAQWHDQHLQGLPGLGVSCGGKARFFFMGSVVCFGFGCRRVGGELVLFILFDGVY